VTTSSGKRCTRVELSVVVERSGICGMRVAEDVTALSTVVAASEVAESSLASRVVTDGGFRIGLPVLASRLVLDLREHIEVEVTIDAALGAVAGRNTRKLVAKDRHAWNVYQAAVGASKSVLRLGAGGRSSIVHRHPAGLGREQVGAQSRRHVHGPILSPMIRSGRCGIRRDGIGTARRIGVDWRDLRTN
jgi:hypothetical protein